MPPPSTRSFVTLAFAAELSENPALLGAYASAFDEQHDATLVVYAPGADELSAVAQITDAAARVGVDLARGADVVVFIDPDESGSEDALTGHCHAVLTDDGRSHNGALPTYGSAHVGLLREFADEFESQSSLGGPWIDESLPGWMTRPELEVISAVAAGVPSDGVIVEIGSFAGRSSAHWAANSHPSVQIYCMDPFDAIVDDYSFGQIQGDAAEVRGRPCGELFAEYTRAWADRVTAVPEASPPRAWQRAADVIFVDGDHSYEGVARDLEFWINHLKPGGRLLGHDWDVPGVRDAVHEFAQPRRLAVQVHPGSYVWELWAAGRPLGTSMD